MYIFYKRMHVAASRATRKVIAFIPYPVNSFI